MPAQAADRCAPDSIATTANSIHAGQKVGLLVNGAALSSACTTDDLGVVQVVYGPKVGNAYKSGLIDGTTTSWKWKDFSYEDLTSFLQQAKITLPIDAQSLFILNFYRLATAPLPWILKAISQTLMLQKS